MSQKNVEVVRQLFAAIDGRDIGELLRLTDPQIERRSFFALRKGGEYHGHDGLRQYLRDLDEAWETLRPEFDGLLETGDVVVGVGRVHYCGKGSGVEGESPAGWLFKLRNGKVVRFRALRELDRALESLWRQE